MLGLTLTTLQLTIWSTASEEDPAPEVMNTTGTANSHHCYQGTTNTLKGQKPVSTRIEIMVIHTTALLANIIHIILLGIPLTQVIIWLTQEPQKVQILQI